MKHSVVSLFSKDYSKGSRLHNSSSFNRFCCPFHKKGITRIKLCRYMIPRKNDFANFHCWIVYMVNCICWYKIELFWFLYISKHTFGIGVVVEPVAVQVHSLGRMVVYWCWKGKIIYLEMYIIFSWIHHLRLLIPNCLWIVLYGQ